MKKSSTTPHFEVDYKTRLEQQRTANNAVRLPRLGFQQYRVYNVEEAKDKVQLNGLYGKRIGSNIKTVTQSYNSNHHWTHQLQIFIDDLAGKMESPYTVKWLKPKQATLLRLKGHRVEEVE